MPVQNLRKRCYKFYTTIRWHFDFWKLMITWKYGIVHNYMDIILQDKLLTTNKEYKESAWPFKKLFFQIAEGSPPSRGIFFWEKYFMRYILMRLFFQIPIFVRVFKMKDFPDNNNHWINVSVVTEPSNTTWIDWIFLFKYLKLTTLRMLSHFILFLKFDRSNYNIKL